MDNMDEHPKCLTLNSFGITENIQSNNLDIIDWSEFGISDLSESLESVSFAITSPNSHNQSFTFEYKRRRDDWTDVISLSPSPHEANKPTYRSIALLMNNQFRSVEPNLNLSKALGDGAREQYIAREAFLKRQEEMIGKLFSTSQQFILDQTEGFQNRHLEFEKQLALQEQSFNEKIARRMATLDERETDLEKRQTELDDRDNRHVRRATYKAITAKLTERSKEFTLTKGTRNLRWVPWGTTILFLVFLISGSFYFTQGTASGNNTALEYLRILRQILMVAGACAVFTFLIRMQQKWSQRHADEEFRLKRLDLDIERATWLVELALEWKAEKGEEMPKELVERLSRNLFADEGQREGDIHPLETVATALLGHAGSINLKMPGGTVEYGRKETKEMTKE